MDIDTIYQEMILEYSRKKENCRELSGEGVKIERGHNPSCGDDLTLLIKKKDGIRRCFLFRKGLRHFYGFYKYAD